jgi:prepilin-type processing-associated H-X9-DG protein
MTSRPIASTPVAGAARLRTLPSIGATLPGLVAINATNGEQTAGLTFPLTIGPPYGSEGTSEAFSFHQGGAQFVFGDGAVHFIRDNVDIRVFTALITRAKGDLGVQGNF